MKKTELTDLVMRGGIVCVGNYLSGKAETISVRDRQNGGRREMTVTRETIITDTDPVVITNWMPDDKKASDFRPSAKKGELVLVRVTGMESNNGLVVLRGTLEVLS